MCELFETCQVEFKPKFREIKSIDSPKLIPDRWKNIKMIDLLRKKDCGRTSPERYQDEFPVKIEEETSTFERQKDRIIS